MVPVKKQTTFVECEMAAEELTLTYPPFLHFHAYKSNVVKLAINLFKFTSSVILKSHMLRNKYMNKSCRSETLCFSSTFCAV